METNNQRRSIKNS